MRMKKTLLVAALTLMGTFMAQASQVSWTLTNVKKNGVKLEKDTYITYLFNASDISKAEALDAAKTAMLDVSKAISSSTGKGPGVTGQNGVFVDYEANSVQTFYAVVYDSLDITQGQFFITDEKTVSIYAMGSTQPPFGSQENATWIDVVPVPEPTTFALLALGLAAFGLKRKIA